MTRKRKPTASASTTTAPLSITLDDLHAPWRGIAARSPEPLSGAASDLGTFEFYTSGQYGTLREGDRASKAPDGYVSEQAGYRRRIESWNLTTDLEGFIHARNGPSTYGGIATFYEDADKLHLRVTGTVEYASQSIGGTQISTLDPNGFRRVLVARDAHLLHPAAPRLRRVLHPTCTKDPSKLNNVDDLVYNEYRFVRDSFVFLQALFWYTPYFNDIFYLRPRATMDVRTGEPGAAGPCAPVSLLDFGNFDINAYVDASWYKATSDPIVGVIHPSSVDAEGGVTLEYNIWSGYGSLDIVPGVSAYGRANDGGWQGFAFVNIYLSRHRGLRDFSSLELDFSRAAGRPHPLARQHARSRTVILSTHVIDGAPRSPTLLQRLAAREHKEAHAVFDKGGVASLVMYASERLDLVATRRRQLETLRARAGGDEDRVARGGAGDRALPRADGREPHGAAGRSAGSAQATARLDGRGGAGRADVAAGSAGGAARRGGAVGGHRVGLGRLGRRGFRPAPAPGASARSLVAADGSGRAPRAHRREREQGRQHLDRFRAAGESLAARGEHRWGAAGGDRAASGVRPEPGAHGACSSGCARRRATKIFSCANGWWSWSVRASAATPPSCSSWPRSIRAITFVWQ